MACPLEKRIMLQHHPLSIRPRQSGLALTLAFGVGLAGCGAGKHGHAGDGLVPAPPTPDAPQLDSPGQGGDKTQLVEGRVQLEPRSFADLLADVAPGFTSETSDGQALAKLLDKTPQTSDESADFRLVRSPNDLAAPEGAETEHVEQGAACSSLYSAWLTDSLWLPLKLLDIANTIRYGVNPV
jgi:hypothetical protein